MDHLTDDAPGRARLKTLFGPSREMLATNAKKGRAEQVSDQEKQGNEKNFLPWIQKYLEMADLLIRRGKRKSEQRSRVSESPASNAIRSSQQRNRS